MRLHIKITLAAVMVVSAHTVLAASTADLHIVGTVVPGACTPVFVGGGVVDYGSIAASDLSATTNTTLQPRSLAYTIACEAPVVIGTSWTDDRLASALSVNEQIFGLGSQSSNKIGYYTVRNVPSQTWADGVLVDSISSDGGSGLWTSSAAVGNVITQGSRNRLYSFAAPGTLIPAAHMNYSGGLTITATIAPTGTLDMTAPVTLDGLSTMEVRYL
ncbi:MULTISPECIES: DUF1120 domain-containing protein [unclassified Pseudomonas]|uniref:DUF1120 domain-containing protein n=1 Tax=unclassified Pseudomonas TaxID=196821 RepID=UPI002AC8BEDA|nr:MULTISPECIES: DUF1120 domain-containing protein [unclassified Pseudomonas]MEB0047318.1 DUF1120 domain-containing protein [Pseudomonas sp. Dout3]MEB0096570.1 DUF1120 domain-containing protein [Pseudomonas sp. DC1.2]WPX60309.1 DUF1120 domain-containing protein [Pseudomonas sp. DC1.2]